MFTYRRGSEVWYAGIGRDTSPAHDDDVLESALICMKFLIITKLNT
jgi:hypothetical protein